MHQCTDINCCLVKPAVQLIGYNIPPQTCGLLTCEVMIVNIELICEEHTLDIPGGIRGISHVDQALCTEIGKQRGVILPMTVFKFSLDLFFFQKHNRQMIEI